MKKVLKISVVAIMLLSVLTGCGGEFTEAALEVPSITVTSASVTDEGKLLTATAAVERNNPQGENQSPAVNWETVEGANYYAVMFFDTNANWLHLFVTDITDTELPQGAYADTNTYVGAYPPKSKGTHTYRISVFAIKEQPNDTIGKLDGQNSYAGLVNHLNQVGNNSDNILAYGYMEGTYTYGDQTTGDKETP